MLVNITSVIVARVNSIVSDPVTLDCRISCTPCRGLYVTSTNKVYANRLNWATSFVIISFTRSMFKRGYMQLISGPWWFNSSSGCWRCYTDNRNIKPCSLWGCRESRYLTYLVITYDMCRGWNRPRDIIFNLTQLLVGLWFCGVPRLECGVSSKFKFWGFFP